MTKKVSVKLGELFQKYFPVLSGVIGGCIMGNLSIFPDSHLYLTAMATVASILCGLTGTSISILLSSQSKVIDILKHSCHYIIMMYWVRETTLVSLLWAIVSIGGFYFEQVPWVYHCLIFGIGVYALVGFIRLFWYIPRIGISESKNIMQADKKRYEELLHSE